MLVFNNRALGWVLHGMGDKAVVAAVKAFPDATRPFVIDVPTTLAASFRDVTQDIAKQRRETGY